MSWAALLMLIADELGEDAALRVERRARLEMAGVRLTVGARPRVDARRVDQIAPGRPQEAARVLGVHQSTVYRALRRPLVR